MNLFRSDGPGGFVVRRLMPAAVTIVSLLGFLRWGGEQEGLYGATVGVLLLTVAAIGVIGGLIWYFAIRLDRDEAVRRQTERELIRSSRYFDLSRDLLAAASFDGYFKSVNPAVEHILGWSAEEFMARPFIDMVHPDDRAATLREVEKLADGVVTFNFVNRYEAKDGSYRWLDWNAIVQPDEPLMHCSARDVTERKAVEEALEASERRTRQILETAQDAFISIDTRGTITDWNPQAEANFGWSRQEALGRELAELILPAGSREAHRRGIAHFLASGEGPVLGKRIELAALHREGHEFPVELTIWALQTEDGYSFNAFLRDITERKATQELLNRQREQLIEAQSVGNFGSWEWDIAADSTECSAELLRIYGIEPGRGPLTFGDFLGCVHPDDRAGVQAEMNTTQASGEPFCLEHRIVQPDGAVRIVQARGEVIMGDNGAPLRFLGTVQDITERREVERAKDEFTSVVSHELRTPLTSIRGSLGLLESGVLGALPAKGQRMVEIAVQNTDRLVRLINDILDIERIDSGMIDMRQQPCDAAELIEHAIEGIGQYAAQAQVRLLADAQPAELFADPDRVLQTLTNLISNAVKFSRANSTVRVSSVRRDGEILFEVSDEGRGIPADKLDLIFERFQQVDARDAREKGGTGLGLAICRTIVERHGGRIWVDSELGRGSTFSFVMPAHQTNGSTPRDRVEEGPTILICDDDASVVEVIAAMLEQHGYRVITARSGEQALERARAERPDAILLDLLMPGISGWETAAALEQHPETRDVPIVILSVLSQVEAEAPRGQVADWLEKPLDEAALFEALERAISAHRESFKVLVVEDDPDLAVILTATFERHGIKSFHAANGREAIELSQRVLPDLLVLDVGLPAADGFQVVDWLRQHERLSALPMVVYTARDLDEIDRERLRLGATTEFLTKGRITPKDFEHHVMRLLGRLTRNLAPVISNEPEARVGNEPGGHPVTRDGGVLSP